jgi:hypothetical protein
MQNAEEESPSGGGAGPSVEQSGRVGLAGKLGLRLASVCLRRGTCARCPLSSFGGEGWGEEAVFSVLLTS